MKDLTPERETALYVDIADVSQIQKQKRSYEKLSGFNAILLFATATKGSLIQRLTSLPG